MWCSRIKKLLSDYLSGNVTEQARTFLESHLESCSDCARYFKELKRTDELLTGLRGKDMPPAEYWNNYWPSLEGKLHEQFPAVPERPYLRILPRLRWALEGALAVLLIANLLFFLETGKFRRGAPVSARDSFTREIRIFREAEEMFPDSIQWMLVHGKEIDLELTQAKKPPSRAAEPLLLFTFDIIRFDSLFSRRTISSPRMLVFNREEVKTEFYDELNGETIIYRYQMRPELTEEKKVKANVRFSLLPYRSKTETLPSQGFHLNTVAFLQKNRPCELARFKSGEIEYLIYITAYPAEKKGAIKEL